MGGTTSSKPAVREPPLPEQSLWALFQFLDRDSSGTLTHDEVQQMYEAMLGGSSVMKIKTKSYDFNAFKKALGDAHARHPTWNVASNLVKFMEANLPEPAGGAGASERGVFKGAVKELAGGDGSLLKPEGASQTKVREQDRERTCVVKELGAQPGPGEAALAVPTGRCSDGRSQPASSSSAAAVAHSDGRAMTVCNRCCAIRASAAHEPPEAQRLRHCWR